MVDSDWLEYESAYFRSMQMPRMYSFSNVQSCLNWYPALPECKPICAVPITLGLITGLEIRGESCIAHTESGIDMIVPIHASRAA